MKNEPATIIDNDTGKPVTQAEDGAKDIAELSKLATTLTALQEAHKWTPDCSTPEGYDSAKKKLSEIVTVRTTVDKHRKSAKRLVDDLSKKIMTVQKPIEEKYKAAITAEDERVEREEREAAEKQRIRLEGIQRGFKQIQQQLQSVTLEQVDASLEYLNAIDFDIFEEHADKAKVDVTNAIADLTTRRAALQAQADEAERLKQERAELEKLRAQIEAANPSVKIEQPTVEVEREIEIEDTPEIPVSKPAVEIKSAPQDNKEAIDKTAQLALICWIEGIDTPPAFADSAHYTGLGNVLYQEIQDMVERIKSDMPSKTEVA